MVYEESRTYTHPIYNVSWEDLLMLMDTNNALVLEIECIIHAQLKIS